MPPAASVVAVETINNVPVDMPEVLEASAEPAYSAEVPPASEMAGSDAIVNLQSSAPAVVEASRKCHRHLRLSLSRLLITCRLTCRKL
ncbi:MAG: hypothetical protein MUC60_10070 [Oscillatoria sp. Prado101]|nr:hypothetical protein [Oscillatoria sp. Prado101]